MKQIMFIIVCLMVACNGQIDSNEKMKTTNIMWKGIPFQGCVVLEGDSNTEMIWVGKYSNQFYNLGVSSSTTEEVIARMAAVREAQPSAIVLMIGTNDIGRIEGLYGAPMTDADYLNNMQTILTAYKTITSKVYVVSILPMTPYTCRPADSNPHIISMNASLKTLVESNGCTFIDEWVDFYDSTNNRIYQHLDGDGLHLNEDGRFVHMSNVMEAVL